MELRVPWAHVADKTWRVKSLLLLLFIPQIYQQINNNYHIIIKAYFNTERIRETQKRLKENPCQTLKEKNGNVKYKSEQKYNKWSKTCYTLLKTWGDKDTCLKMDQRKYPLTCSFCQVRHMNCLFTVHNIHSLYVLSNIFIHFEFLLIFYSICTTAAFSFHICACGCFARPLCFLFLLRSWILFRSLFSWFWISVCIPVTY